MSRILFWSDTFWPYVGGTQVAGARLVPALRERGHEIIVVTSHSGLDLPDEDDYEGIPVHRLAFHAAIEARDIGLLAEVHQGLRALKRRFEPELIHINFPGPSAMFQRQTASAHPAPLLVTLRSILPDQFFRADSGLGFVFRSADWISANSLAALEHARRHLPEIVNRSSVIYNGIGGTALPHTPVPFDPPRLVCIGRLAAEKGFDLALAAFAILVARFPSARLLVGGDGPERTALEQQAAGLGLAGAVDFLGWIAPTEVPALMRSASVVLIPSRTESLPNVAIEAGQAGRVVVATRVGGVAEGVLDGETGVLVEPGDSCAMADAVAWLLERPERARRMAATARRRVAEDFRLEQCVDDYDALYRSLIQERAGVGAH